MNSKNEEEINEKINIILRQTDYSYDIARYKLKEFDMNHILVIKEYFGLTSKNNVECNKSIQQEIYKQIRLKLDVSISKYNDSQYKKIESELNLNK